MFVAALPLACLLMTPALSSRRLLLLWRLLRLETSGSELVGPLSAGVGQAADEPIGLTRGNDREIPRKLALTYSNWNSDHEQGTVTGDRGSGSETQVDTAELAMVLTPSEAQAA